MARRQRVATDIVDVGFSWPLFFWQRCVSCNNMIRREKMWVSFAQGAICTTCAPTKMDAATYFLYDD